MVAVVWPALPATCTRPAVDFLASFQTPQRPTRLQSQVVAVELLPDRTRMVLLAVAVVWAPVRQR
jgi:hypothetical protein